MNEHVFDFDDIFDVWSYTWWEQPWVWFGIGCGLLLFIGVLYSLFTKYWLQKIKTDPRQVALKRLYAVNPAVGISSQEEYKYFYAELLTIIKEYLDCRYGYASSGKTDYELLEYLKSHGNAMVFYPVIKQLVEHGLTIKFALESGEKDRVKDDYSFVLEVISQEPNMVGQK